MEQIKQESYYVLDCNELDEIIQKHLNKPEYNCVANHEWTNDTSQTCVVSANITEYDEKDVQLYINSPKPDPQGRLYWGTILSYLAKQGVVPEGNYLVEICW